MHLELMEIKEYYDTPGGGTRPYGHEIVSPDDFFEVLNWDSDGDGVDDYPANPSSNEATVTQRVNGISPVGGVWDIVIDRNGSVEGDVQYIITAPKVIKPMVTTGLCPNVNVNPVHSIYGGWDMFNNLGGDSFTV